MPKQSCRFTNTNVQTEGTRFEVIQKFSDPPLEVCPSCGGPVRRLPSSPAIQFKGSGWYITDYAKKSSTEAGKDGGKDSGKDGKAASDAKDASNAKDSSSGKDSIERTAVTAAKPAASPTSSTSSSDSKS